MKTRHIVIGILIFLAAALIVGFKTKPEIFHIKFVSKEVRTVGISADLGKALEHYYDEWGRYPVTDDEDAILKILRDANYLKDEGSMRTGEFTYEPVNDGQRYSLK